MKAAAIACWVLAWFCAAVAAAAAWSAMRTGSGMALGWMAAGGLGAAGFALIGTVLW